MKLFVLFCLVVVASAAPSPKYYNPENVQILKSENEIQKNRHRYYFEQSDGTKQEQQGELRNEGSENEVYAVSGSFTWIGPDGTRYTVNYVADENGYQPEIGEGPGALPYDISTSLIGG